MELGVQSMDEEVLKLCNRGHSRGDVTNAVGILKEFGFFIRCTDDDRLARRY
jgi:histone acetyltransferase (RNA polymerase elongator complex component)